jgi:pimeloyl-[acyl-carrier protein] methyl ester esterase
MASTPGVMASAMVDDMLADLRPGLAAVKTPVTILYETPIAPMIQAGYASLGPKTLIEVPNAKHFIMYDQPARFDAEVDAFLKR